MVDFRKEKTMRANRVAYIKIALREMKSTKGMVRGDTGPPSAKSHSELGRWGPAEELAWK